jgi:REP element-mobilizing transposase RayT
MARRPRVFALGLLHPIIVRRNQKQKTFLNNQDYQAYLEQLAKYRKKFAVTVDAFCLMMPNHVHLLVGTSSFPLARFMQGLQHS